MQKGKFFLTGLGLLMQGVKFTPEENAVLHWLCAAASESDAVFWDQTRAVEPGSLRWHAREGLKNTFRRLEKHHILQAHYDRAAQFHG